MDTRKTTDISGRSDPASGQLRDEWERRAAEKGTSTAGVLLQKLPDPLNQYLHERHIQLVLQRLLPLLPKGARLLDIGCGYGRISKEIRLSRPDIELIGIDFSLTYCRLYTQSTGAAIVCADLNVLPVRDSVADAILCVTSMMYIHIADREKVMSSLFRLLRPEGLALFIDPGQEYLDLARLFSSRKPQYATGGTGFSLKDYERLGRTRQSEILDAGGFAAFSMMLPILYLLHNHGGMLRYALRVSAAWDQRLYRWRKLTLHRWMLLRGRRSV
jgi:SAM-dependent methyltransferase